MKTTYNNVSLSKLEQIAQEFSLLIKPGQIISLKGTLGSGKTTFVQFLMKQLAQNIVVSSPTFAIAHEYKTNKGPIVHVDAYRLSGYEDFLDDYFINENIVLIEWFENLGLTKSLLDFEIEFIVRDNDERNIIIRRKDENIISNTSS